MKDLGQRTISAFFLLVLLASLVLGSPQHRFFFARLVLCGALWEWMSLSGFCRVVDKLLLCLPFDLLAFLGGRWLSSLNPPLLLQPGFCAFLAFTLGWWCWIGIKLLRSASQPAPEVLDRRYLIWHGGMTIYPVFWALQAVWSFVPASLSGEPPGVESVGRITAADSSFGGWFLFYLLAIVVLGDIGAYFFGQCWGKTPLASRFSPKKTWEGFLGGFVTANAGALGVRLLCPIAYRHQLDRVLPIVVYIAAVGGDLHESAFKRYAKVKDSGCLIPGHGGILDRLDSFTVALPLAAFWISVKNLWLTD